MTRGRKARATCKCGTTFRVGERLESGRVRLTCPNCGKFKDVLPDKIPTECNDAPAMSID